MNYMYLFQDQYLAAAPTPPLGLKCAQNKKGSRDVSSIQNFLVLIMIPLFNQVIHLHSIGSSVDTCNIMT